MNDYEYSKIQCYDSSNPYNEHELRRLKELHAIVQEFFQVQTLYVEILHQIGEVR